MSCTCPTEVTAVVVKGNLVGKPVWIGQPYKMQYRFSPPVIRSQGPTGGLVPVTTGRLQLRRMTINYANTGYFQVKVRPEFRGVYTSTFAGKAVGQGPGSVGTVSMQSGSFRVGAPGRAETTTVDIENSTFLPCWITGAEWEGEFTSLSRRS